MLKRYIIIAAMVIAAYSATAQSTAEIGLTGGGMYYIGDYNKSSHFKNMQPALGIFYRYNFNNRLALRVQGLMGSVKMNVMNDKKEMVSNKNALIEAGLTGEINFFSFDLDDINSSAFSPYIFGGVNYFFSNSVNSFSFPFGVGVKYKINDYFGMHLEWGMRKTATDYLDTLASHVKIPEKIFDKSYSKDWYSFVGIGITFNLNPMLNKGKCIVKPSRRKQW